MTKIFDLIRNHHKWLGSAFVAFEAAMHVYLVIYLTFHWTNWLIWGFTAFELSMFIYLLTTGNHGHKKNKVPVKSLAGFDWIDETAPPNGIGPVCRYCNRLIDSPEFHGPKCPIRV